MSGHRRPGRSRREIKESWARDAEKKRQHQAVSKMKVFDLLEHMDAVGSAMAQATHEYRKDSDEIYPLMEIRRGLDELQAVVGELILRHEAAHDEH